MFGIRKVSEAERLRALYADQSDSELLRLHEERDGLTDTAQAALAAEMKKRGLGTDQTTDQGEAPPERGEQETGEVSLNLASDEILLYRFDDAFDLREAIRVLEEAGIELRVLDRSAAGGQRSLAGYRLAMDLIVRAADAERAGSLLREARQLFPYAEEKNEPAPALATASDLVLLLMCERADALSLVPALSGVGISFLWRDGREDKNLPDTETVAIEVHAAQRERAEAAMQGWMNKRG